MITVQGVYNLDTSTPSTPTNSTLHFQMLVRIWKVKRKGKGKGTKKGKSDGNPVFDLCQEVLGARPPAAKNPVFLTYMPRGAWREASGGDKSSFFDLYAKRFLARGLRRRKIYFFNLLFEFPTSKNKFFHEFVHFRNFSVNFHHLFPFFFPFPAPVD